MRKEKGIRHLSISLRLSELSSKNGEIGAKCNKLGVHLTPSARRDFRISRSKDPSDPDRKAVHLLKITGSLILSLPARYLHE
jgi:hypothetical protein